MVGPESEAQERQGAGLMQGAQPDRHDEQQRREAERELQNRHDEDHLHGLECLLRKLDAARPEANPDPQGQQGRVDQVAGAFLNQSSQMPLNSQA